MEELAWVLVPVEKLVIVPLVVLPWEPLEAWVVDKQLVLIESIPIEGSLKFSIF